MEEVKVTTRNRSSSQYDKSSMSAMPPNRIRSYAARLRTAAGEHGAGPMFRMIVASLRWRLSAESRLMQVVAKENAAFDARFGIDTSGEVPLARLGMAADAASRGNGVYRAIPESRFHEAMSLLQIKHSEFSFVDYGAGKGKALLLAGQYPFRNVLGVEWSAALCEVARANIRRIAIDSTALPEIGVICGDATAFAPPITPLVCFFFNPFDDGTWRTVLRRLEDSWDKCPRSIHLAYVNVRNVNEIGGVLSTSRVFTTTAVTQHCWILSSPSEREQSR